MHKQTRDGRHASRPSLIPGVLALTVALAVGLIMPAPAAAQLQLRNGDFENNPLPAHPYVSAPLYVDPGSPTGPLHNTWKVTHGDINTGNDPAGTTCQAGPTSHCIDLNGTGPGRIEQSLGHAIADQTCTVVFWMSRHVQLGNGSATLHTFVNGVATTPGIFVHNVPGITAADGKWEQKTFTFSATAGSATTLAFQSAMQGAAGPQVDNVAMKCVDVVHDGTLVVHKVVVNTLGVANPATFSTTTHCSASVATPGINTPLAVPGGGTVTQSPPVAAGDVCSVTEVLPPSIPSLDACKGQGATWTASYSPPVTIVAGQTAVLTVTNTLTCNRPTGGTLQIHKTVVNTLGVPTPPVFNMTATCSGMTPVPVVVAVNGTVTVPPAGQIADGTVCTIAETLPPQVTGVKACPSGTASWVASNAGSLTIHTAQTTGTIITNTLQCDRQTNSDCPNPALSTIGCRVTVTIKRTKGPAIYSVAVSPPPTSPTPTPNIAPSTATSCVIAGGAMINQTTCWFNYNTNATPVTLTAISSSGALPAGFGWTGPCILPSGGSTATCKVSATLSLPPSVIANFP
jgi:hypothetical protein